MIDILSIGDCTIDVFLTVKEGNVNCDLKKQHCQICFNYGDKIPVEQVTQIPGTGNAANLAIGSARLGLKSAIATIIGNEGSGELIIRNFKKEKVNYRYATIDKKSPTNYSAIINYDGERTIFSHHESRKYSLPKLQTPPKWIYLTSVGPNYEKLYRETVAYCRKHNVKLGFNPGTLQVRDGLTKITNIFRQADLILVNKEEAQMILDTNNPDPIYLMSNLRSNDHQTIVITDGQAGAYSFDGHKYLHINGTKTKVIERTGAGDSFSTGLISALIHNQSGEDALRWATANADSVIKYIGPQKGLLTLKEIKTNVQKQKLKIEVIGYAN